MGIKYRLALLILSISSLLIIGKLITGSFDFVLSDIWFASGIFLVVLISLIDQPHFSKDGSVFLNSITAGTTLLTFSQKDRSPLWYAMLTFTAYLLFSSYILMWIRKAKLKNEPKFVSFLSRINRETGKPTVIFSIFFFWGIIEKFGLESRNSNFLFFFWSVFIVLNIPAIATSIESLFSKKNISEQNEAQLISITNPLAAFIHLASTVNASIGSGVAFFDRKIKNWHLGY
jgi:hypothetical protein